MSLCVHYSALVTPDAATVIRQALAGMLWSKQFFFYDVGQWLKQHGLHRSKPTNVPSATIAGDTWSTRT